MGESQEAGEEGRRIAETPIPPSMLYLHSKPFAEVANWQPTRFDVSRTDLFIQSNRAHTQGELGGDLLWDSHAAY